MSNPNFKYTVDAFFRDTIAVELPSDPKDLQSEKQTVTFTEFNKTNFQTCVKEFFSLAVVKNPQETDPAKRERYDFETMNKMVYDAAPKWLALASGKDEKYFTDLLEEMSETGTAKLIAILPEVNHVEEIMATQGNLLMLPMIREALAEPEIETPSA